jgi:hypothetical protein
MGKSKEMTKDIDDWFLAYIERGCIISYVYAYMHIMCACVCLHIILYYIYTSHIPSVQNISPIGLVKKRIFGLR